jgi:glycosyltransferase involved in cell wall biosynthesis
MRRVLIVAYDFPPRGATGVLRVAKWARYLPQHGWQPVVVTAAATAGLRDDDLLAQLPADLEVLRVRNRFASASAGADVHRPAPTRAAQLRRQLRRPFVPDPQLLWLPAAVDAASNRIAKGGINAILTSAPPFSISLAGLWLKRRFPDLPWLMDLRDIWSERPGLPDLVTYKANRALERACLERADHVTTATDGQRRLLIDTFGIAPDRVGTITNGFDPADLPPPTSTPPPDQFRLTYVGSIVGTRVEAAHGLFDALERLRSEGVSAAQLEVRLIGIFDPQIHRWAAPLIEAGLMKLLPFVPYTESFAEMRSADALLLITTDDREGRVSQPNKLFEYLALQKPILALAPPGDVTTPIEESNAGITVAPRDVGGIVGALRALLSRRDAPQPAPDADRLARFDRRNLTRQLAALLDRLVDRRS